MVGTVSQRPAAEPEVTREMRRAGSDCLEEFIGVPGGLTNSADYVAAAVYRAMEKQRRDDSETGENINDNSAN